MMRKTLSHSYLFGGNAPFIEELYETFLTDPTAVSEEWRSYFEKLSHLPTTHGIDVPHQPIVSSIRKRVRRSRPAQRSILRDTTKQVAVMSWVNAFRMYGHLWANIDPLKRFSRPHIPELTLDFYGLTETDILKKFIPGTFWMPSSPSTLREISDAVRQTYCEAVGFDDTHVCQAEEKVWLQNRIEPKRAQPHLEPNDAKRILERLTAAEILEKYLHTRYVGQKRFSLEGGESLIVAMDELIQRSAKKGVQEIVIGMAHRGRLNVLINTLGKTPKQLFTEFDGQHPDELSSGDVKYHQGFSSDYPTPFGPIHLSLAFNPSHLEIVNPVVEGSVRSRQDRRGDPLGEQVMPVLIHGDAAFSGQGVNQETLNLSKTRHFGTGGTIHIIVNNQIGFTTSDPRDMRSTHYCTDIAKMLEVPVFHVNGDNPESVFMVTQIALDYRMKFHKDVVIDIVCYRRLGHNEQDEPMVTQPLMYKKIQKHLSTRTLYANALISKGVIDADEPEKMIKTYRTGLESGTLEYNKVLTNFQRNFSIDWSVYSNDIHQKAITGVPINELKRLSARLCYTPDNFELHSRVKKIIADRQKMGNQQLKLDWGMAENLAYATLLVSGHHVRISGQDCSRGTFFHRHAVFHHQNRNHWDEGTFTPLQNLQEQQATFTIIDSVLSEVAVLGFEYGYSASSPDTLVIWEAQFGDFANGAQVVIDQFISSGEAKWGRLSGLTMLLPHGFEGQGPEHSSARVERYLQLCADNNMQVCMPSLPAQMFHLLRRQMLRLIRKPLIIFTPKSLLRHQDSTSHLEDLSTEHFLEVIPEISQQVVLNKVRRVLLCSGKIYFELAAYRNANMIHHVAIIRVEQFYPFPLDALMNEITRYRKANEVVWVQEEPRNQGVWYQMRHRLEQACGEKKKLHYWGREASSSSAVGYASLHKHQQSQVVEQAFTKKF